MRQTPPELKLLAQLIGPRRQVPSPPPRQTSGESPEVLATSPARGEGCFNWQTFLDLADDHGVSGFLHEGFAQTGINPWVPPAVREKARHTALFLIEAGARRRRQVQTALSALRKSGLPFIVIKGWAHLEPLYGETFPRPVADLDILVREKEAAHRRMEVRRIIQDAGIDIDRHVYPINTADLPARARCCAVDVEALWRDARTGTVVGIEVAVLSPADHVITLALDFALSHGFGRLLLLKEIMPLAEKAGWGKLVLRSKQFQAQKLLYLTLLMGSRFLEYPVPEEVLVGLRPSLPTAPERWLEKRLSRAPLFTPARYVCIPILLDSWRDQAAFARELLWPADRWFELRGHKPSVWNHLIHSVTLAGKAGAVLWKAR